MVILLVFARWLYPIDGSGGRFPWPDTLLVCNRSNAKANAKANAKGSVGNSLLELHCIKIDGEILAWRDGAVRPFGELQTRIIFDDENPPFEQRPAFELGFVHGPSRQSEGIDHSASPMYETVLISRLHARGRE